MAEEAKPVSRDYPKSMHVGGLREGAHLIVQDADEEAQAREEGYKTLSEVDAERVAAAKKAAQERAKAAELKPAETTREKVKK